MEDIKRVGELWEFRYYNSQDESGDFDIVEILGHTHTTEMYRVKIIHSTCNKIGTICEYYYMGDQYSRPASKKYKSPLWKVLND
jgi:hypothetical protein